MLDDFLVRAALAALGCAMAAGLLGCFVLWRRMAYFGDATAHAAILGVALALGFSLPVFPFVLGVAGLMALLIHFLSGRGIAADALLGVLAHGGLALGLVGAALMPGTRIDLEAWLFGDVLTVTHNGLALIWAGGALVCGIIWWQWQSLLTATLNADLARSAGINPARAELTLTLLIAAVVAVAIKVVGALLITGLLIVPAATARRLSNSPEAMALWSVALGAASALLGLLLALRLDTPAGPSILCVAVAGFALVQIIPHRR
ncbi:MAG: metal ABC transporter permease [Rhodobacteraceae bacterium]|nr:metal ABC transporter permease [Paracoccaceae bacterium]